MSHISDILGPEGNLIAVLGMEYQPKEDLIHRFRMRHQNTVVIFSEPEAGQREL